MLRLSEKIAHFEPSGLHMLRAKRGRFSSNSGSDWPLPLAAEAAPASLRHVVELLALLRRCCPLAAAAWPRNLPSAPSFAFALASLGLVCCPCAPPPLRSQRLQRASAREAVFFGLFPARAAGGVK